MSLTGRCPSHGVSVSARPLPSRTFTPYSSSLSSFTDVGVTLNGMLSYLFIFSVQEILTRVKNIDALSSTEKTGKSTAKSSHTSSFLTCTKGLLRTLPRYLEWLLPI